MRPNVLVVRTYALRGARLWLVTRAALSAVLLLAQTNPAQLPAAPIMGIVLLSVGVSLLETHLRRERAFLGNLGVRPLVIGLLFAAPALIGELAIRAGGTVFR